MTWWIFCVPILVSMGMLIFLMSWWSVAIHKDHFLSLLMILEMVYLSLLCVQMGSFYMFSSLPFFVLLVLSACEGAMGLAVLVGFVSIHGNDRLRVSSLMKC